ncbi:MAG: methyltransferase [Acidimicrobiia bacterium]|nr:methyltransferase [Acidimicrobiia bacterium]
MRPTSPSAERQVPLVLPDLRLALVTDRGTFAAGGVDPGTKLLLLDAPPPPAGATTLVDVGTGYGPIAVTLARRHTAAEVWAVDVNERALALCRRNAAAAGATNVVTARPEEVPEDLVADAVYSNPPIRIGKRALHQLLDRWLGRLAPQGRMILVVHRHLGADSLQRWLGGGGRPVERLTSRAGYRLISVGPTP